MDELVEIMREMLDEIKTMNSKLDDILGSGAYNIDDVCIKLDAAGEDLRAIRGYGLHDSIADVCEKLDSLATTITMGANY